MADSTVPDIRTRILLAAKALFAQQGFNGTTVRQVCEAADANVALVSYHFGGKEKLLQALFDEFFPKAEAMDRFQDELSRPAEGLAVLIEEIMRYTFEDPEMATIIEQEVWLRTPRIAFIQERVFPFWGKLRDLLRQGREEGVFRFRSLDRTLMMVLGIVLFPKKSAYFQALFGEGEQRPEDIIQDSVDFIYAALGASNSSKGAERK